jgi:phosphate transport system permease protein
VVLFILLFSIIGWQSLPAFEKYGLRNIVGTRWAPSDLGPEESEYGLLPALAGTLIISTIAVILALPMTVAVVLALEEYAPSRIRDALGSTIELMAGLPTIVYGLWGVEVLGPFLQDHIYNGLYGLLGFIPLFSCKPVTGYNLATAGVLLSIMILDFK